MKIWKSILGLLDLAVTRFTNPFYMLWTAGVISITFLMMHLFGSSYPIKRELFINVGALVCTAIVAIAATYFGPRSERKRRFISLSLWIVLVCLIWIGVFAVQHAVVITFKMVMSEFTSSVLYTVSSILGIIIAEFIIYVFSVLTLRLRSIKSDKTLPPKTDA